MIFSGRPLPLLLLLLVSPLSSPIAALAAEGTAGRSPLAQELDALVEEADARKLLEPHLGELKKLPNEVVEKIVLKQWWTLAQEIVAASHTQQVDLSVPVRKAVRTLKDEADELLRTLNPKYGQAQQVSPAFQWAQNDTCVFLTIKYTVRWNAPGALEVTEPSVNMSANLFSFSGLGKHSNNKYRYSLSLKLFDFIDEKLSTWSAASVGKLSVTLRKSWPRKWPRLLVDKKTKIGNMHVWMDMQEKLESTMDKVVTASHSRASCALASKLYCLPLDTCKPNNGPEACKSCTGKDIIDAENSMCAGLPVNEPQVSFSDEDFTENEIGGAIKITKATKDFDITEYVAFYADLPQDQRGALDEKQAAALVKITSVSPAAHGDTEIKISLNTALTKSMTHIVVYAVNKHGRQNTPAKIEIKDAFVPTAKPGNVAFHDTDGDKGAIGGTVTIEVPEDHEQITEFSLYYATIKRRHGSIDTHVNKPAGSKAGDIVKATISKGSKWPKDGITHIVVYAKNVHGENPNGVYVKLADNTKPCLARTEPSCPGKVTQVDFSSGEIRITAERAKEEASTELSHYVFYWGKGPCTGSNAPKHGLIKEVPIADVTGNEVKVTAAQDVPKDTTHILAFSKSSLGESKLCESKELDVKDGGKEL